MDEAVRSRYQSRVVEAAAAVLVELITAEGLSGTHTSLQLSRFHLKIPSLEIFAQGKIEGKIDANCFCI